PEPRHLVARVVRDPEHRERVLDVRRLEELEPAVLHERDVAARELDLEHVAVVAGAEQYSLFTQPGATFAVAQDRPADGVRLVAFVDAGEQRGEGGTRTFGPQGLLVTLRAERDRRVRRLEDRARRSVVAFELDDRRPREPRGELERS